MILKCTACGEKMRVPDEGIPPGKKIKVRCPHCQTVGVAWLPETETGSAVGEGTASRGPSPPLPAAESTIVAAEKDLSIPVDAFNNFRFPSEEDNSEVPHSRMNWKMRLVLWIAASVGVILVFALFVNLILPGPPR